MTRENWLQAYTNLNNSFKHKYVFRVGAVAGFFSEYNHMIFAIVYCLRHRIKFVLSSKDNNFSIEKGWQDFFLPFCDETDNKLHAKYNFRGVPPITKTQDYSAALFRKLIGVKYLTYQLLGSIREQNSLDKIIIPELGFSGNFIEACHMVVSNLWQYQPHIEQAIIEKKEELSIPKDYIGIHIRGGDKVTEHKLFTTTDYLNKAKSITSCKVVYVATDDYSNILTLNRQYPDYTFLTNCNPQANGHMQSVFDAQGSELKKNSLLDLFVDVDILNTAEIFIGTYSSNIGLYMGIRRDISTCHTLDFDNWHIW